MGRLSGLKNKHLDMIKIGGHVSAAGGIQKAVGRATDLEFQCFQIHPSAPQRWQSPNPSDQDIQSYAQQVQELDLPSFMHNVYLVNFASEDPLQIEKSIKITKDYLNLASRAGSLGVPTHLGSHKGRGLSAVLPGLSEGVQEAIKGTENAQFIIENTAGAGGNIGRDLKEFDLIMSSMPQIRNRLGICIDTCHAFAAGIPIHTQEGLDQFMDEFEERFGLESLSCIHLNDSKHQFGSGKDRHENIGDGFMGNDAFARIFHHPKLQKVPFIMEVPGIEGHGPDAINRERVVALAS